MIDNSQILYTLKNINRQLCCINGGTPTEVTFAPSTAQDAFGRLRTSSPLTLFDSSHRFSDNGLWATATTTDGTATFNADQGLIDLTVTSDSGSSVTRQTYKVFSYQPGKSLLILTTFVMSTSVQGLTQQVGYYDDANGFYFEVTDTDTVQFVKRSSVTGSIVETPVLQADWNGDKLDGTGASGITLDVTKAQILWMDMEWLGVGSVRMGFVIDNQFIVCHTFKHANIVSATYITTACLPITYEIFNSTATSESHTMKQICSTVISEGGYEIRGEAYSIGTGITAPYNIPNGEAGVYKPLISIKLNSSYLSGIVIPTGITCLAKTTGYYEWRLVEGGTTSGGSWTSLSSSIVDYNITGTSFTGGTVVHSGFFDASNQGTTMSGLDRAGLFDHQLARDPFTSTPVELTLCVATNTTPGGGCDLFAHMDWEEISR